MRNPDRETVFKFKRFEVTNRLSAMKVGTDGVLLGAWCLSGDERQPAIEQFNASYPERILDVGAGTGLIALMMAQRFPSAKISAVEIDHLAAEEAKANFYSSPWSDRLSLWEVDFNNFPKNNTQFDLIVSNPPFFTNGALPSDSTRLLARHESSLTIDALLGNSKQLLTPNGAICLILPADREDDLQFKAIANHLNISKLTRVTTVGRKPPQRILAELRHNNDISSPLIVDTISIHDGKGGFTKEYSSLVKDFYLKF